MKKFLASLLVFSLFSPLLVVAQGITNIDGYNSYGATMEAGGVTPTDTSGASSGTTYTRPNADQIDPVTTSPIYLPTESGGLKPVTTPAVSFVCPITADTVQNIFKCSIAFVHYRIIPAMFAITFILFVWNAFAYVREANNEVKRKDVSKFFSWSVWIFFLTLSIWGIVAGLQSSFSISGSGPIGTTVSTDCPSEASGSITNIIQYATCTVVNMAIPALVILIITVFFWNILNFVKKGDASAERLKANSFVMYSVFGFFILFSVWGFVSVLGNSFSVTKIIPQFGTQTTAPVDKAAQFTGATGQKIFKSP